MAIKYNINIQNTGGEYTLGRVDDEEVKNFLLKKIEENDKISSFMDDVSAIDNADILAVYGPEFEYCNITIENSETLEETTFSSDENYIAYMLDTDNDNKYDNIELNTMLWGTQKIIIKFNGKKVYENKLILGM